MKRDDSNINHFIANTSVRFCIPMYQRNYVWKKQNCEQLLEDILKLVDNDRHHFFGVIVYIQQGKNNLHGESDYMIIDGQQRITTIMLLLKAIHDITKNDRIKQKIKTQLIDIDDKLRLKPIAQDEKAFEHVIKDKKVYNQRSEGGETILQSHILKNYEFFKSNLNKNKEKTDSIYAALNRLDILGIGLEQDDDPQVVFERINATGEQLRGADLIRNYLMMCKTTEEQERLFKEYWQPMESCVKEKNPDIEKNINKFIEVYLRIYYGTSVSSNERDIYKKFKLHTNESDTEKTMQEMLSYADIYQLFIKPNSFSFKNKCSQQEEKKIKGLIVALVKIKFGISYPFVMRLVDDFLNDKLDYMNLCEMLELLISYYVRRKILNLQTAALNDIVYVLYDKLRESEVSSQCLAEILGKQPGRNRYPNDEEIKRYFQIANAYDLKAMSKFILVKIEEQMNADGFDEEKLQIEHFYPQNAGQDWCGLVGEEYIELENVYLHTFGNLSLTGQNLKLGNKPFEEKIKLLHENGSLKLNEYFTDMNTWGIEQIRERSKYLADKFCEIGIFKDLPKEYRKTRKRLTLEDNWRGVKFSEFSFPDNTYVNASKLEGIVRELVKYIQKHHNEKFRSFLEKQYSANNSFIVPNDKQGKEGYLKVDFDDGFSFFASASGESIRLKLREIVKEVGLDPYDFYLTESI